MNTIDLYSKCLWLGMSFAGAAGCVANILFESGGRADNLQDGYNSIYGITDAEYVRQIDTGKRSFFDSSGFGYCQWTAKDRKAHLLDYAKRRGKSIADSDTQFLFMVKEMREEYPHTWSILTHGTDPYEAAYVMCKEYEIPDNTEAEAKARGNRAVEIYKECSGTEPVKDADKAETFWPPRMVDKGMRGADIYVLQAVLVARGYSVPSVSGVFDDSTDKAVRKYQKDNSLVVDGVVGNNTWTSLLRR